MAQNRGMIPANIDNVDKVVYAVALTTQKKLSPKWKRILRQESSDRKFERRVSYASFTTTPLKGEGEDVSVQYIDQGYTKDFTHLEFGLGFEVTQTAEEDDAYDIISDHAAGMVRSADVTRELYAARLMNLGFTTETSPDGVAIFSASHTLIKGGTASNLVSADLSRTSLETALTLIHTDGKSDEGHFMEPPDGYILEVPPASEFLATRLVNSTGLPGTADNDINSTKARYSIEVLVNPYFSDTDSWRLVAKNKQHGLLTYVRKGITMEPREVMPRSGNRLYKLRFRQSWGCDRFQGVVGSPGA